jgi:hypothetical protein
VPVYISVLVCEKSLVHGNMSHDRGGGESGVKALLIADLMACDSRELQSASLSKRRKKMGMIVLFSLAFLGFMALFSSYENIRNEDDEAREKRLAQSSSLVVSISHVDYGVLLPSQDNAITNSIDQILFVSSTGDPLVAVINASTKAPTTPTTLTLPPRRHRRRGLRIWQNMPVTGADFAHISTQR